MYLKGFKISDQYAKQNAEKEGPTWKMKSKVKGSKNCICKRCVNL